VGRESADSAAVRDGGRTKLGERDSDGGGDLGERQSCRSAGAADLGRQIGDVTPAAARPAGSKRFGHARSVTGGAHRAINHLPSSA
jgi:hypothetical protein